MTKYEDRLRKVEAKRARPRTSAAIEYDPWQGPPDFEKATGRGVLVVPRRFESAAEWARFAQTHTTVVTAALLENTRNEHQ